MPQRPRYLAASALSVLILVFAASSARAEGLSPRVRAVDPLAAAALERGLRESPTLVRLVDALERSDVLVHIETCWIVGRSVVGMTRLIGVAGEQRYLRITVDPSVQGDAAVALIGHELQHALEMAQVPWVTDERTLASSIAVSAVNGRDRDRGTCAWTRPTVRRPNDAYSRRFDLRPGVDQDSRRIETTAGSGGSPTRAAGQLLPRGGFNSAVRIPDASPGCWTDRNSVLRSAVHDGPDNSASHGPEANCRAMPAFGPEAGTRNMPLFANAR
jgi:hypothetical protein